MCLYYDKERVMIRNFTLQVDQLFQFEEIVMMIQIMFYGLFIYNLKKVVLIDHS